MVVVSDVGVVGVVGVLGVSLSGVVVIVVVVVVVVVVCRVTTLLEAGNFVAVRPADELLTIDRIRSRRFSNDSRTASRTGSILALGAVALAFYSVLGINLFNSEQVSNLVFSNSLIAII